MFYMLKGAVLGVVIAAPVGPIGLLCITRSLRYGWLTGFVCGLGAAVVDGLYALAAIAGLAAVLHNSKIRAPLHVTGALFLIYLGVRTMRSAPPRAEEALTKPPVTAAFVSTAALTAVNPATIISFAGIFAAAIGSTPLPTLSYAALVAGVVAGSCAWWAVLAASAHAVRERLLRPGTVERINVCSGALLIAFAIYSLIAP